MTIDADLLGGLFSPLVDVPGVRWALLLSSDGLVTGFTGALARDAADPVAAACAGLGSMATGLQQPTGIDGQFRQTIIEFSGGFVFLRGAAQGSRLAVATEAHVDPGLIAQAMVTIVTRIGEDTLSTPSRR